MAQGVDVEWVRTAKPGEPSRPPEELEAELRELRDEVRRLREQVAALAATSPRPMPEDARIPTYVARLDTSLEGGVPKAGVIAITGPGGSMKTSLALYILIKNRAAGRRGVYVTVEESRESILRTMRHHGLGTDGEFLVDIARLRVEHEGAEEIRDWLRVLRDFLVRRNQRERIDLVVIDTMDVLVSMAHLQDVRNELFHFFHFLRSMGVTTYVIANVDPSRGGVANDVTFPRTACSSSGSAARAKGRSSCSSGVRRCDTRTTRGITSCSRTTKASPRDRTRRPGRPDGAGASVTQNAPLIFARSILMPAGVAMRMFLPTTATSPPQSRTALFSSAVIRFSARSALARLVYSIIRMFPLYTWAVRSAMS